MVRLPRLREQTEPETPTQNNLLGGHSAWSNITRPKDSFLNRVQATQQTTPINRTPALKTEEQKMIDQLEVSVASDGFRVNNPLLKTSFQVKKEEMDEETLGYFNQFKQQEELEAILLRDYERQQIKTGRGSIPFYGALDIMGRGLASGFNIRRSAKDLDRHTDMQNEILDTVIPQLRTARKEGDKEKEKQLLNTLRLISDEPNPILENLEFEQAVAPDARQVIGAGVELALLATMGYGAHYPAMKAGLMPRIARPVPKMSALKIVTKNLANLKAKEMSFLAQRYGFSALQSGAKLSIWSAAGQAKIADTSDEDIIAAAERGAKLGLVIGPAFTFAGDLLSAGLGKAIPIFQKNTGKAIQKLEKIAKNNERIPTTELEKSFIGIAGKPTIQQQVARASLRGIDGLQKLKPRLLDRFSFVEKLENKLFAKKGTALAEKSEKIYRDVSMGNDWADGISNKRIEYFKSNWEKLPSDVKQASVGYMNILSNLDRAKLGYKTPMGNHLQVKEQLARFSTEMGPDMMAKLAKVREQVSQYTKGELLGLMRSGLIDAKQMKAMMKAHPNYIPHQVIFDNTQKHMTGIGQSMNVSKTELNKAIGSLKDIKNPLQAMLDRTILLERVKQKNILLNNIIDAHKTYNLMPSAKPLQTAEGVRRRQQIFTQMKSLKADLTTAKRGLKVAKRADVTVLRKIKSIESDIQKAESNWAEELTKFFQEGEKAIKTTVTKAATKIIPNTLKDVERIARETKTLTEFSSKSAVKKAYQSGLLERGGFKTIDSFFKAANDPYTFIKDPKTISSIIKADIDKVIKLTASQEKATKQLEILRNIDKASTKDAVRFFDNLQKDISLQRKELWTQAQSLAALKKETGASTINFYKDGIKETWQVPSELEHAIKGIDTPLTPGWIRAMTTPQRLLKKGATSYNPAFILRNKTRDLQQSEIIAPSLIKDLSKKYGLSTKNANKALQYTKKQQDLMYKKGGLGVSIFEDGQDRVRTVLQKNKIATTLEFHNEKSKNPFALIKKANQFTEQSTRKNWMVQAMNAGYSPKDALFISRRATVDFSRMGTWTRVANQAIPFLNARVQGLSAIPKAFLQDPSRFSNAIMNTSVMPTFMLHQHNRRYESYKYINQSIKDTDWIIMTGEIPAINPYNGDEILIPQFMTLKRGEGQTFVSSPIRHWLESEDEIDDRKVSLMLADMFGSLSPTDFGTFSTEQRNIWQAMASQLGPLVTMAAGGISGEHPYFGSDIVPRDRQDAHRELQFSPHTPEILKDIPKGFYRSGLAQRFEVSPAMLDFYISTFGGLPQDIIKGVDLAYGVVRDGKMGGLNVTETPWEALTEIPVIRSFVKQRLGGVSQPDEREIREVEREVKSEDILLKDRANEIITELRMAKTPEEAENIVNLLGDELTDDLAEAVLRRADARKTVDGLRASMPIRAKAQIIILRADRIKQRGGGKEEIIELFRELEDANILTDSVAEEMIKLGFKI